MARIKKRTTMRRIIMSKSKMIVRTKFVDRACHWTV
ncbi:formate dehydrogenase cytochrome b556 subunit, partial [Salmonella enterica]|nr:formate dehydrogenase cytochrome b556 subunit [Salmonella enterica]